LTLRQEMVDAILIADCKLQIANLNSQSAICNLQFAIQGVKTAGGTLYRAPAVILTTGTFLKALMHMGEAKSRGGRAGDQSADVLSDSLQACGIQLARFKTGTPCRLNGRTIDFSRCEPQPGDADPRPFSFATERITQPQMECHITYTNEKVHELIR